MNCFRKFKISSESQKVTIAEDDNPFKELEEKIQNLLSIQPDLVSENMDAAFFTDIDAEVLIVQSQPSDAEIVAELLKMEDVSNDNDDVIESEDEPVCIPPTQMNLLRPCKNSPYFQKVVQLFNLMRIMFPT